MPGGTNWGAPLANEDAADDGTEVGDLVQMLLKGQFGQAALATLMQGGKMAREKSSLAWG